MVVTITRKGDKPNDSWETLPWDVVNTPNREAIEHWSGEQLARIPDGFLFSYSGFHLGQQLCTMSQKNRSMFLRVHGHHTYTHSI